MKNKLQKKGRKCSTPGCQTLLSTHNPGEKCFTCQKGGWFKKEEPKQEENQEEQK